MQEVLNSLGTIGLYIIPAVSIMLVARKVLKVPDEFFLPRFHGFINCSCLFSVVWNSYDL